MSACKHTAMLAMRYFTENKVITICKILAKLKITLFAIVFYA